MPDFPFFPRIILFFPVTVLNHQAFPVSQCGSTPYYPVSRCSTFILFRALSCFFPFLSCIIRHFRFLSAGAPHIIQFLDVRLSFFSAHYPVFSRSCLVSSGISGFSVRGHPYSPVSRCSTFLFFPRIILFFSVPVLYHQAFPVSQCWSTHILQFLDVRLSSFSAHYPVFFRYCLVSSGISGFSVLERPIFSSL
jgi:hypothetical protein